MKRPSLTPHLLAATLFLAGGLRAAETQPVTPAAKPPREAGPAPAMKATRAEDLLRRFDKNGDGKLDEDEQAEAHEIMLREQMTRRDAKAAAAPEAGQPFRQKMLELFDKNHDGRLDDDERAEARKYAEEHGLGEGGAVRAELMKRFDKNADGKLDGEERAALGKFLRETELARLQRIADDVAKRRAQREGERGKSEPEKAGGEKPAVRGEKTHPEMPAGGSGPDMESPRRVQLEAARLERVAAEVAKRRAEREKAKAALEPK